MEPDEVRDAMKEPVRLMKFMFAWTRGRGSVLTWLGRLMQLPTACFLLGEIWFLLTGPRDDVILILQAVSDFIGICVFSAKGIALFRNGKRIEELADMLEYEFDKYEDTVPATKERLKKNHSLKRKWICKVFLFIFASLFCNCALVCIASLLKPPGFRTLPIYIAPTILLRDLITFVPVVIWYYLHLYTCYYGAGAFDVLFICLAIEIRTKLEILQAMLKRTAKLTESDPVTDNTSLHLDENPVLHDDGKESITGSGRATEFGNALPTLKWTGRLEERAYNEVLKCISYHQLINKFRNELESICAPVLLGNLLFILICLGTPAVRILYSTMDLPRILFLLSYCLWVLSQLLFFCWCGDKVAQESVKVAEAGYYVYDAFHTSTRISVAMNVLTARAQRPLILTAAQFLKLNFEVYLDLMQRSYSFYAAILRMR